MNSESRLYQYSQLVDGELRRILSERDLPLYSMMGHQLGWDTDVEGSNGSGLRRLGALCLGACVAISGDVDGALPTAAAIELVQNFCDIHDDIQSGRVERSGRDSVWWKWGPAQAINAGDGMHALARMALLGMMQRGFGPDVVFDAIRVLDRASLATCEGRFMELEAQERLDVSTDSYLSMASLKTGAVFACAAEFGALAAGADAETRARFAEWGACLGTAVQISDDLRQFTNALGEDGVPSDDLMNKRKLYPVVWAFEKATPRQRRQLGDYYFKRVLEPSDARELVRIVDCIGGTAHAQAQVDSGLAQVRDSLAAAVPGGPCLESLELVILDVVGVS